MSVAASDISLAVLFKYIFLLNHTKLTVQQGSQHVTEAKIRAIAREVNDIKNTRWSLLSSYRSPKEGVNLLTRTNVSSLGSVFNDTRKVKVLSLPETIKEKPTFRAKAFRRELVTNSRRRAFARNVGFFFIVLGSERTVDLLNVSLDHSTEKSPCSEKIKIKSCTEYESSIKRFKDARKEATKTYCSEALVIHDRIFAAKLQVSSKILENLDNIKTAIAECLPFLRHLHGLTASVRYSPFVLIAE